MRQTLRGHNVWLNVAFDIAGPALEHICSQRLLYPREVQATVIAPYCPKKLWWWKFASHAKVLHVWPAGSELFSARRSGDTDQDAARSLSTPTTFPVVLLRYA